MKTTKFIFTLLFIAVCLISCASDDDSADQELIINGTWFLIQSCSDDNEECSDVVKGNYIFNFNQINASVIIEKNGTKFPPSNYEIRRDALGSWLFIDEDNMGRLVTLTSRNLVLRSTQISVLSPDRGVRTNYYVR